MDGDKDFIQNSNLQPFKFWGFGVLGFWGFGVLGFCAELLGTTIV
jgi:hypothetical protein